jgi:hypothetical protein
MFAAQWNGSRWAVQVLPRPAGNSFLLLAVSCWQPGQCAATGGAFNGNGQPGTSVVERQAGAGWALQQDAAPAHTTLYGVSCPSAQSCTAVGGDTPTWPPPSPGAIVAEQWDGTTWALQATPAPPRTHGFRPPVVRVDGFEPASGQLPDNARLPGARHPGQKNPLHT